jgi:hypothetical protein
MRFYDTAAASPAEVTARFAYYTQCGRAAIEQWRTLLLEHGDTPAHAAAATARSILLNCRHPPAAEPLHG